MVPLARREELSAEGASGGVPAVGASLSSMMTIVVALPFRADRPARVTARRSACELEGELRVLLAADVRPLIRPSRGTVLDRFDPVGPLLLLP